MNPPQTDTEEGLNNLPRNLAKRLHLSFRDKQRYRKNCLKHAKNMLNMKVIHIL